MLSISPGNVIQNRKNSMSGVIKSKLCKSTHSNAQITLCKKNKLTIIDKINSYDDKLKNDSSDNLNKDDIV